MTFTEFEKNLSFAPSTSTWPAFLFLFFGALFQSQRDPFYNAAAGDQAGRGVPADPRRLCEPGQHGAGAGGAVGGLAVRGQDAAGTFVFACLAVYPFCLSGVQALLKQEFIQFKLVPVFGYEDLKRANEQLIKDNSEVGRGGLSCG